MKHTKAFLALGTLTTLGAAYLLRILSAHRRPRPVPRELLWGEYKVQLPGDGVGKLFHCRYSVVIDRPQIRSAALIAQIKRCFPDFCPKLMADFTKTRGSAQAMRAGDEYSIGILGPWDGRVRVTEVTRHSFTFVTLEGHPEAGQITFAVVPKATRPGAIRFEINSWARSRDMLVNLSYDRIKVGQEVQKSVWVTFCEQVVEASGGTRVGEVEVVREERTEEGEVIPIV